MAREELSINVTAKDDASKVLDNVSKKAESLEDVKVKVSADTDAAERDIAGLLQKVDKLGAGGAANLLLATNASTITNEIADLVIKLDTLDANDPQVDITVANIGQLSGDLDQISAKAKEINDTPIKLDTSGATEGIDRIAASAGSSRSVLANMVGNSTQDLGALGGVAGSAGVAIGQMGEYMADASADGDNLSDLLSNFGAVAGPIAGIAAATELMSEGMKSAKESAEAHADSIGAWEDAMRGGGDAAQEFADNARESGEIMAATGKATLDSIGWMGSLIDRTAGLGKVLGEGAEFLGLFGNEIQDLTPLLAEAGVTIDKFAELATAGDAAAAQELFAAALSKTSLSADDQAKLLTALGDQQGAHATATENAAAVEKVFGTAVEETTKAVGDDLAMLDERNKRLAEMKSAFQLASAGLEQAIDDADAFAAALDRVNEASGLDKSRMMLDTVDSFDAMKEAIKETKDVAVDWATVDLTPDSVEELKGIPDELAAVTEGISGMRDTIQTELNAAFETGGIDAYTEKAEFFRTQVLDQFPAAFEKMGASSGEATAQATALADELGLMPEDIQIMIQLTREEEARAALDAFSSVISQMPESVQVSINTLIAQGDIEAALSLLNNELINRGYDPIILPVDANTQTADAAIAEVIRTADNAEGTITVDADKSAADTKTDAAKAKADQAKGEIKVDADTGLAAAALLTFLSIPRTTKIFVGTEGVPAANEAINTAARDRTATITVRANASSYNATVGSLPGAPRAVPATSTAQTAAPTATAVVPYASPAPIVINMPTPQPTNVTVQAGVIGNRFDVDRVVSKALRRHQRFNGQRS